MYMKTHCKQLPNFDKMTVLKTHSISILLVFFLDHNEQFRWKGTGQILFSTDPGDGYDEDADESGASYNYNYKPIIALPDLVDVKTGTFFNFNRRYKTNCFVFLYCLALIESKR